MKFYSYISILVLASFSFSISAADEKSEGTKISGAIEIEAGFGDGNSDISLATVEVGLDHSFNDKAEGHILFAYDDDSMVVDEATIALHPNKNISITTGRMTVPFGQFDTNMISDPLTLELGETGEDAIQLGLSSGSFSSSFYVFKDDEDGSDKIDDYGLNLSFEKDAFSAGISMISDVNDKSDATHSAKGVAVHAKASLGRATVIAEHLSINKTADGKKPKASHLELGLDFGSDRTLAFAMGQTKNAETLDLPKKSFALAYRMPVYEKVGLAIETMKTKAYDGSKDTAVTLQLGYEF